MRAARTDQAADSTSRRSTASAHPMLWGVFALMVMGVAAVLLPWKDALVAIVALGPVLAIARADLEARVVPDIWVLALAGLGLDIAIAHPHDGWVDAGEALVRAAASVAVAVGVSRLAGWIGGDCLSHDALGTGDLAVIGVSALWLPLSSWLLAVLMSSLAASLVVATRARRIPADLHTEIPYAAFLALAAYAVGLMTSVETVTGWTGPTAGG